MLQIVQYFGINFRCFDDWSIPKFSQFYPSLKSLSDEKLQYVTIL